MIKLTSTCAFVKPVSVDAFKTVSLYMVPVSTILPSKNRSEIPLCSSEIRVRFAIVFPYEEQPLSRWKLTRRHVVEFVTRRRTRIIP